MREDPERWVEAQRGGGVAGYGYTGRLGWAKKLKNDPPGRWSRWKRHQRCFAERYLVAVQ